MGSGNGGLDLSNSLSHRSLTVSSNSSRSNQVHNSDGKKASTPASPMPAACSSAACSSVKAASPSTPASPIMPDPMPAACSSTTAVPGTTPLRRSAEKSAAKEVSPRRAISQSSPSRSVAATPVLDENLPPTPISTEAKNQGKPSEAKKLQESLAAAGRTDIVKRMRARWEKRLSECEESKKAKGSIGESPKRIRQASPSESWRILKESNSEDRFSNRPENPTSNRSNSASLAHYADAEKRRTARRIARSRQHQDSLMSTFRALCPAEAADMEARLQRSSDSESESLADEVWNSPKRRGQLDEGNDWCRVLEKENRALMKLQQNTLQVLTGYLKTKSQSPLGRSETHGHFACPKCSAVISCPQCAAHAALDTIASLRSEDASGQATAKALEAPLRRDCHGILATNGARDEAAPFAEWPQSLSPTSPPTVQEEEPAREPDAGTLCP